VLFIGIGGKDYSNVARGIDYATTPFLRVMSCDTLNDVYTLDSSNPRRYVNAVSPLAFELFSPRIVLLLLQPTCQSLIAMIALWYTLN